MDYVLAFFSISPIIAILWNEKNYSICNDGKRWFCEYELTGEVQRVNAECIYCIEKMEYVEIKCIHCGKKRRDIIYDPCSHHELLD